MAPNCGKNLNPESVSADRVEIDVSSPSRRRSIGSLRGASVRGRSPLTIDSSEHKLLSHVERYRSLSPVRGIDRELAITGHIDDSSRRGSNAMIAEESPRSSGITPLQPIPTKLQDPETSFDLEKACEHVSVNKGGTTNNTSSRSLTLTLHDPENFDYALSLLQNSSNLFDQV